MLAISLALLSACNFVDARNNNLLNNNVVKVTKVSNDTSGGTGFYLDMGDNSTFVVTNAHVCENYDHMVVQPIKNSGKSILKVVKADMAVDLCLLRSNKPRGNKGLKVSRMVTSFTRATMMGFALLEQLNPQHGYATNFDQVEVFLPVKEKTAKCFNGTDPVWFGMLGIPLLKVCIIPYYVHRTTLEVYPGNSGSPVINDDGDVIGVISGANTITNYGHMVPLSSLRTFLGLDNI
jgi:hypothetical protein